MSVQNAPATRYQISRKYRSELGVSGNIEDILPRKLTLYPELNPVIWRESKDSKLQTIFQEVAVVPFEEANPGSEKQLGALENIKREVVSEVDYVYIMWDAFKAAVMDMWIPEKHHIVFASGGFDSRLLSMAIMDLYVDHGDSWLGDLVFIEADGEAATFRKNMGLIGWSQDRCHVYNEGAPDDEYHARSLDFGSAWRKLGGMSGYPVSFLWEAQTWLQERGLMPLHPDLCQVFTGYLSNEIATTMRTGQTLYKHFSDSYRKGLSSRRSKAPTLSPFKHFSMFNNVMKYGAEHIQAKTGLSAMILKYVATKQLAGIPSMKHKEKKATVRRISDRLLQATVDDYEWSWFGKLFPDVEPTPVLEYHPWWGHWCVASFCQHLLTEGYKLAHEKVFDNAKLSDTTRERVKEIWSNIIGE